MKIRKAILFLIFVCAAWFIWRSISKKVESSIEVRLESIPGISSEVLAAQGKIVQIEDPVPYFPKDKMYLFTVTVLKTNGFSKETDLEFFGDSESIAGFFKEIKFVNEQHGGLGERSMSALKGGRDDIESIVSGLVNIVMHPIDTATAIMSSGPIVVNYFKEVYDGKANLKKDASDFADAYAENVYMEIADQFGLNYEELQSDEAKESIKKLGRAKIRGMAATEILTIFVSWLKVSKVAKAGEIAEATSKAEKAAELANASGKVEKSVNTANNVTKIGKWANAFQFGAVAELGAARMARAASMVNRVSHLDRLKPLLEPEKIAALKGVRALNPRLHKVLYWLNQAEKDGHNVQETLTRAMKMASADKRLAGTLLDPAIDQAQILKTYDTAKAMKIFEEDANLDLMRHGIAPWVNTPWGRQQIWVEHEVPVSWANELGNCWGNLSYETQKYNAMRGNKIITKGSMLKLEEYKNAGLLKQDRINEIIRTSVGKPAAQF